MRYIFLIVCHLFPRRRWKEVGRIKVYGSTWETDHPIAKAIVIESEDQFGNKRFKRLSA